MTETKTWEARIAGDSLVIAESSNPRAWVKSDYVEENRE